jgi:hypothetical protein
MVSNHRRHQPYYFYVVPPDQIFISFDPSVFKGAIINYTNSFRFTASHLQSYYLSSASKNWFPFHSATNKVHSPVHRNTYASYLISKKLRLRFSSEYRRQILSRFFATASSRQSSNLTYCHPAVTLTFIRIPSATTGYRENE